MYHNSVSVSTVCAMQQACSIVHHNIIIIDINDINNITF